MLGCLLAFQGTYHAAYAKPDRPLLRGTGSGSVFGLGDHPGYVEHVKRAYKQWGAHAQLVLGIWIPVFVPCFHNGFWGTTFG